MQQAVQGDFNFINVVFPSNKITVGKYINMRLAILVLAFDNFTLIGCIRASATYEVGSTRSATINEHQRITREITKRSSSTVGIQM